MISLPFSNVHVSIFSSIVHVVKLTKVKTKLNMKKTATWAVLVISPIPTHNNLCKSQLVQVQIKISNNIVWSA